MHPILPVMSAIEERGQVRELGSLRLQANVWRWALTVAVLATAIYSLATLNHSVRALATTGQEQDEFVAQLQEGLNKDIVPQLQSAGAETVSEIQPQLMASFNGLGKRLPEVAAVAKVEFQSLETDLPAKSETILNQSFDSILTGREGSIRKMYPDLSDEQVKGLVMNLADEGRRQSTEANQELFAAHEEKLKGIMSNLELIKTQEASNVKGVEPSWDMAILLLDILREDVKSQGPVPAGSTNDKLANSTKATTGEKA